MDEEASPKPSTTAPMNRRRLLALTARGLTAAMSLSLMPGNDLAAAALLGDTPFKLGVASGDPQPNSIVIWTRLAPKPLAVDGLGGMPSGDMPVGWQVATDSRMKNIVAQGTATAPRRLGYSVHVEVNGLRPARPYYYRFSYRSDESSIGRTITAPALGSWLGQLNFAFACCQDWASGFYNAHYYMARENIDLVLHLGDYIYDTPISYWGGRRQTPVPSVFGSQAKTLAQYRLRYSLYKTDPDLQEVHRRFPFVCVWDDHEVENDYAGPYLQYGGSSLTRRAAAYQAFYENLPLRAMSIPAGPDMRIYRRLTFGDLVTFNVLDTRQYRSGHPCGVGEGPRCDTAFAASTTILGDAQENWLADGLSQSRTRWNVVAQQVLMAQLDHDVSSRQRFWLDAWDPYVHDRRRLMTLFNQMKASNPVVLSGDWHSTFASNLKLDFDNEKSPNVATEFSAPSMTSGGDDRPYGAYYAPMLPANPHIKYFEGDKRGYFRVKLSRSAWESDVRFVTRVESLSASVTTGASFAIQNGVPGLQMAEPAAIRSPMGATPQGIGRRAER